MLELMFILFASGYVLKCPEFKRKEGSSSSPDDTQPRNGLISALAIEAVYRPRHIPNLGRRIYHLLKAPEALWLFAVLLPDYRGYLIPAQRLCHMPHGQLLRLVAEISVVNFTEAR